MKEKEIVINRSGWLANFIVGFLLKNRELAKGIVKEVFPEHHLARNPGKRKKKEEVKDEQNSSTYKI